MKIPRLRLWFVAGAMAVSGFAVTGVASAAPVVVHPPTASSYLAETGAKIPHGFYFANAYGSTRKAAEQTATKTCLSYMHAHKYRLLNKAQCRTGAWVRYGWVADATTNPLATGKWAWGTGFGHTRALAWAGARYSCKKAYGGSGGSCANNSAIHTVNYTGKQHTSGGGW